MPVAAFLSHDVRIDTESAAGHAHMAVYFFTLTAMGLLAASEGMPAARAAAMRALELDAVHAPARAMLALVAAHYERDWASARREFAQALSPEPVPALVRFHYACWYLSPLERDGESLAQLASALSDDPVYLIGRVQIGVNLIGQGRFEQGVNELEDVLRIDPRFGPASGHLGRELALRGRTEEALALAERTYAAIPRHPNAVGFLAGMLARAGEHARATALLATLERTSPWAAPRARAEASVMGERWNDAFDALREAVALRDPGVWILMSGAAGRALRRTRGWDALRAELRLPPG
jgi:Tfp pilus assembly protein PilF